MDSEILDINVALKRLISVKHVTQEVIRLNYMIRNF